MTSRPRVHRTHPSQGTHGRRHMSNSFQVHSWNHETPQQNAYTHSRVCEELADVQGVRFCRFGISPQALAVRRTCSTLTTCLLDQNVEQSYPYEHACHLFQNINFPNHMTTQDNHTTSWHVRVRSGSTSLVCRSIGPFRQFIRQLIGPECIEYQ